MGSVSLKMNLNNNKLRKNDPGLSQDSGISLVIMSGKAVSEVSFRLLCEEEESDAVYRSRSKLADHHRRSSVVGLTSSSVFLRASWSWSGSVAGDHYPVSACFRGQAVDEFE